MFSGENCLFCTATTGPDLITVMDVYAGYATSLRGLVIFCITFPETLRQKVLDKSCEK